MRVCDKHRYIFIVPLPLIDMSEWRRVDEYFVSYRTHRQREHLLTFIALPLKPYYVRLESLRKCTVF